MTSPEKEKKILGRRKKENHTYKQWQSKEFIMGMQRVRDSFQGAKIKHKQLSLS